MSFIFDGLKKLEQEKGCIPSPDYLKDKFLKQIPPSSELLQGDFLKNLSLKNLSLEKVTFTLIELVMVIVILGILAVSAIPRFADLSGDAEDRTVQGITSALNAAAAIKYAESAIAGNAAYPAGGAALLLAANITGVTLTSSGGGTITGNVNGQPHTWTFDSNTGEVTDDI